MTEEAGAFYAPALVCPVLQSKAFHDKIRLNGGPQMRNDVLKALQTERCEQLFNRFGIGVTKL